LALVMMPSEDPSTSSTQPEAWGGGGGGGEPAFGMEQQQVGEQHGPQPDGASSSSSIDRSSSGSSSSSGSGSGSASLAADAPSTSGAGDSIGGGGGGSGSEATPGELHSAAAHAPMHPCIHASRGGLLLPHPLAARTRTHARPVKLLRLALHGSHSHVCRACTRARSTTAPTPSHPRPPHTHTQGARSPRSGTPLSCRTPCASCKRTS